MPNDVTNNVVMPTEVLNDLLVDELFSFSSLLPIPADEDPIFTAKRTDYGDGGSAWSFDGYCPMDWARENWGTKWDAYNHRPIEVLDDTYSRVRFDTAWNAPDGFISAFVEKYPTTAFIWSYADEDRGHNVGVIGRNPSGEVFHNTTEILTHTGINYIIADAIIYDEGPQVRQVPQDANDISLDVIA